MAFSLPQSARTGRFHTGTDQAGGVEEGSGGPEQPCVLAWSCRPHVGVHRGRPRGHHGCGHFQPASAGSSVCEFRMPDHHRLPGSDQAVVPD